MTCEVCGHEQDRGRFCGRCGARSTPPEPPSAAHEETTEGTSPEGLTQRPEAALAGSSQDVRWQLLAGALVLVVVVAVAQLVSAEGGATSDPSSIGSPTAAAPSPGTTTAEQPSSSASPVDPSAWPIQLNEPSDTVLLFDDGHDGGFAVDLDAQRVWPVALPGQRAGDQPFRFWQMGGWLVVGWEEIFAVALGAQEPRKLADATVFVPAAEPDQVWLLDYASGRTAGPSEWTLVDASGEPLAAPTSGTEEPIRGVPGGLALRRDDGSLAKYDLAEGQVVDYLGDGPAFIADVTRHRVAWCEDPCAILTVSDGAGSPIAVLDDAARFRPGETWLSDNGQYLAAPVAIDVGGATDFRFRLYRVETSEIVAESHLQLGRVFGDWSDAGRFFYWVKPPEGTAAPVSFGWWSGSLFEAFTVSPPRWMANAYGFVALPDVASVGLQPRPAALPTP